MSFQDKYKEYKERQEAKKYFRSNNDQFLNSAQWSKVIGLGLLTAIASGVVLGIVIHSLHITSSLFYIICALVVAGTVTKISRKISYFNYCHCFYDNWTALYFLSVDWIWG